LAYLPGSPSCPATGQLGKAAPKGFGTATRKIGFGGGMMLRDMAESVSARGAPGQRSATFVFF
jgi:hypothetical protein